MSEYLFLYLFTNIIITNKYNIQFINKTPTYQENTNSYYTTPTRLSQLNINTLLYSQTLSFYLILSNIIKQNKMDIKINKESQIQKKNALKNIDWMKVLVQRAQQYSKLHQSNIQELQVDQKLIDTIYKPIFRQKLSTTWLFIINRITQAQITKIRQIYTKKGMQKNFAIPYCSNLKEAQKFFKIPNSRFKVIADIPNVQQIMKDTKIQQKILQLQVFKDGKDDAKYIYDELKKLDRNKIIKKMINDLSNSLEVIKLESLGSVNRLYKSTDDNMSFQHRNTYFPNYIKLNGEDKSFVTKNRTQLAGAIKMTDQQFRKYSYQQFCNFISKLYPEQKQKKQLSIYKETIKHIEIPQLEQQLQSNYKKILKFYTKQNFFHKIINNMLRFSKQVADFKYINLPFNQMYHAIKYFYNKYPHIKQETLYRGAHISGLQKLKAGDIIEILGFISTSTQQKVARDLFADELKNHGCILVIDMSKANNYKQKLSENHGFIKLSSIDSSEYKHQEEILLNAFSIFKVTKIQTASSYDEYYKIYLQYGVIFELQNKMKIQTQILSQEEKGIVENYRYFKRQMDDIQSHGDVLRSLGQYDKYLEYQNKYKQNVTLQKKLQLSEAQHLCGNTTESCQIIYQVLKQVELDVNPVLKVSNKNDKIQDKTIKVILQQKQVIKQVLSYSQDRIKTKMILDLQLNAIQQHDWIRKCQVIFSKGKVQLIQGKWKQSQGKFIQLLNLITKKTNFFEQKRKRLKNELKKRQDDRNSFIKKLTCCFTNNRQPRSEQDIKNQLQQIQGQQRQFKHNKQNKYKQALQLKLNIINSLIQLYNKQGDQIKKTFRVQQALLIIDQIHKLSQDSKQKEISFQNRILQAKILSQSLPSTNNTQNMNKTDKSKIQQQVKFNKQKSLQIINEQILKQQKIDPVSEKIGTLMEVKAQISSKFLQESLSKVDQNCIKNSDKKIKQFDHDKLKEKIKQTCQTYQHSIAIMSSVKDKNENHPKVLNLRNSYGQLLIKLYYILKSIQQSKFVLKSQIGQISTAGAKAALSATKGYLMLGYIREASQSLDQSHKILQKALIKDPNSEQYKQQVKISQIYIQIQLYRTKIFNKQNNYDTSISILKNVQEILNKKVYQTSKVIYLTKLYEQRANTYGLKKNYKLFDQEYKKVIDLRIIQKGKQQLQNAISYCNIAKYKMAFLKIDEARKQIDKAEQIFSIYPVNHPLSWIPYTSKSLLYSNISKSPKIEQQLKCIKTSLNLLQERYNGSQQYPINYLQIKYKYFTLLFQHQRLEQATKQFIQLDNILPSIDELRTSKIKQQRQRDNERIDLRKQFEKHRQAFKNNKFYSKQKIQYLKRKQLKQSKLKGKQSLQKIEDVRQEQIKLNIKDYQQNEKQPNKENKQEISMMKNVQQLKIPSRHEIKDMIDIQQDQKEMKKQVSGIKKIQQGKMDNKRDQIQKTSAKLRQQVGSKMLKQQDNKMMDQQQQQKAQQGVKQIRKQEGQNKYKQGQNKYKQRQGQTKYRQGQTKYRQGQQMYGGNQTSMHNLMDQIEV